MACISLDRVSVRFRSYDAQQRAFVAHGLGRLFGRRTDEPVSVSALMEATLEVARGQRVAVLGANGSGKTTLARVCSGLLVPTSGVVRLSGRRMGILNAGQRAHPHAPLRASLVLHGILAGLGTAQAVAVADAALGECGLRRSAGTPMEALSTGLVVKAMITTALLLAVDILVIDEVLETAEPAFLDQVFERIAHADPAPTVIVVERARSIITRFCTDAVVLHQGRIVDAGPCGDVLGRCSDRLTF